MEKKKGEKEKEEERTVGSRDISSYIKIVLFSAAEVLIQ